MRKKIRTYRYRTRNLKMRKRVIALTTSVVLGTVGYMIIKNINPNNKKITYTINNTVNPKSNYDQEEAITPSPVPTEVVTVAPIVTPEPIKNNFNKADSVKATTEVNMRLCPSADSYKLGSVYGGAVVNRIISKDGFDLVRYGNTLAFISSDYTDENVEDYNNEYYKVEEDCDVIRTTTEVYFRLGPSKNEEDICLLNKNEELSVIGKSVSYTDPNDIWYLAKYKDKIGFVNAKYTKSLKEIIKQMDPNTTDVKILKMGYAKNFTWIYDNNGSIIDSIDEYQLFKVLEDKGNSYLVEYDSVIGYVSKQDVNTYTGYFVVVDLSSQKVFLYCNADLVFEGNCTTGKDDTPTFTGAFTVDERTNSRYFSEDAQAQIMWAGLRHGKGNGLHDAPWEPESKFGSQSYRKYNGSKGCIRLPSYIADYLKDYIRVGTKVLIKD